MKCKTAFSNNENYSQPQLASFGGGLTGALSLLFFYKRLPGFWGLDHENFVVESAMAIRLVALALTLVLQPCLMNMYIDFG